MTQPQQAEPRRPPGFTCPRCGRTSYHPEDLRQGYCGACHDFTGATAGYRHQPGPTDAGR